MNELQNWWRGLELRERRAALLVAAVLILLVLYSGWQSFNGARLHRADSVERQRETLQWMAQAAADIKQLRGQQKAPADSNESLLGVVDRSARAAKLGTALKRVQPEGDGVKIWLEKAAFDTLAPWLGQLQSRYGAQVTSLSLERAGDTGEVNARMTLERAQP